MKKIIGLTVGTMQVNFSKDLTSIEIKEEVKKYKSFYANKKDEKGIKVKMVTIYN